jgi:hypothetical protein
LSLLASPSFKVRNLSDEEQTLSWQEAIAEDPAYYMDTEQGQKELAEMIRKESEKLIEELGKSVKRTREIIWLSRHCRNCKFFAENGLRTFCRRWDIRLVKPFYGKPLWSKVPSKVNEQEKEIIVSDIDWNKKWKEISDSIVEWAINQVNGGFPYFCYTLP